MVLRPQRRFRDSHGRKPDMHKQSAYTTAQYLQILCDGQIRARYHQDCRQGPDGGQRSRERLIIGQTFGCVLKGGQSQVSREGGCRNSTDDGPYYNLQSALKIPLNPCVSHFHLVDNLKPREAYQYHYANLNTRNHLDPFLSLIHSNLSSYRNFNHSSISETLQ